ncbi:MAG: 23S rRNA (cytidine(2498)-2'-O)-methyltransferase RlmM [Mizugakiibacter sp.]|uniref:23S rRNA (cytidine(2498)-2'-O)-methyltransferase RlmM n=1 Tax=Mizugakiibacter sp. TaxID=1972610 RepID=UPI0031CA4E42|nr:23S rRNA (cytidine(2498)-2'-O)-methyltransferase RlmM [Xanthomonadaceae bacterium]
MAGRLLYCRPGFERECAQELETVAAAAGASGFARAAADSGLAEYVLHDTAAQAALDAAAGWRGLAFARQSLGLLARVRGLDPQDRLGPLLDALRARGEVYADVWIEHADSDAGRELAGLCRSFAPVLRAALRRERLLGDDAPRRLHLCFASGTDALLAAEPPARAAPWPGGIPRLRFPRGAPSRSTLKLEEALLVLLDDAERARWLTPGMRAVDLGAAPGGWTWQMVRRSIRVIAVDNGPMDAALMDSGLVEHRREDGFRYRPAKPVDWLLCDMVEQPRRIAALMAQWFAEDRCRMALFNLKLPMKKRYDEVRLCLGLLRDAGLRDLRAKQLYHDREEITVFARRG